VKKGCFLGFEWLIEILPLLDYTAKMFLATSGKYIIGPSLEKNPSEAHAHTGAHAGGD